MSNNNDALQSFLSSARQDLPSIEMWEKKWYLKPIGLDDFGWAVSVAQSDIERKLADQRAEMAKQPPKYKDKEADEDGMEWYATLSLCGISEPETAWDEHVVLWLSQMLPAYRFALSICDEEGQQIVNSPDDLRKVVGMLKGSGYIKAIAAALADHDEQKKSGEVESGTEPLLSTK